ncbi:hypothetical protein [Pseudomonas sp. IT-P291]|uniref:hypothetical protein n=1 Tax=Pseudomonas sp. IT-P291 TaxID=3026448 RepID=UPI0039DF4949
MPEKKLVEVKAEDANSYCRILTLLEMEEEGDPVAMIEKLIRIADGLFDALQPIGSNYRRCPSTLLTNVVNMKRHAEEDRVQADRYRFLREPKASAPETLPEEKWIVVGRAGHEDILSHEALDKVIDDAMKAKAYEYDPEGGPLLCYQVGDQDWVAAQNPEQALAVLAEFSGDWLRQETDDFDTELASDKMLDLQWTDEDPPHAVVGTLRQWLAEATEPCYLNGTE